MAQNFAVAHEGNPRIDSLEVPGGSLQSDAIRTVEQGVGPNASDGPGGIPPTPPGEPTGSVSSGGKYEFSTDDQGEISFTFANNSETGETGQGHVQEYSFRNGKSLAGFISMNPTTSEYNANIIVDEDHIDFHRLRQLQNIYMADTTIQIQQIAHIELNAAVSGTPISGLAVLVDPISTVNEFHGYVAAYDWSTTTLYLLQYQGEPLTELGTVLTSEVVAAPGVGDGFEATFTIDPNNGSPTAEFFAALGAATPTTSPSVPTLVDGMGVAIVNIGSAATHQATGDESVTWDAAQGSIRSD